MCVVRSMLAKVNWWLDHRWVTRASTAGFVVGAVVFLVQKIGHVLSHTSVLTVLGIVLMATGLVGFIALGLRRGWRRKHRLARLAEALRPWLDKLTAELRLHQLEPGCESPDQHAVAAFEQTYYGQNGLRNQGLPLIDQGKRLGVWDEDFRRRFHNPTPAELWKLNESLFDDFIESWLPTPEG